LTGQPSRRVNGRDVAAKPLYHTSDVNSAAARIVPRGGAPQLREWGTLGTDVETSIAGFGVTVMIWVNRIPATGYYVCSCHSHGS
jgi:hypothetical protein